MCPSARPSISAESLHRLWVGVLDSPFTPAALRQVPDTPFVAAYVRDSRPLPRVYFETELSLYAIPRPLGYEDRCILVPREDPLGKWKWKICSQHIEDSILFSRATGHVVTVSGYKSGGSAPWSFHCQSFPLRCNVGGQVTFLSALRSPGIHTYLNLLVKFDEMPGFEALCIEALGGDYPAPGLRLTYRDLETGPAIAARKAHELAVTYDHLSAFNLVIVPFQAENEPALFFFPRRRSGRATWLSPGGRRWQVAALELNGLLQVKTERDFETIDASAVRAMFAHIAPVEADLRHFAELLETF